MAKGRLRVLLGAAPGVGKTYAMLKEGHRLRDEGHDVVIALVETHGRKATAEAIGDLPIIERQTIAYRGVELTDMDTDAVIERHPEVALVDELAHTNAPGMRNTKRWQDVAEILNAGIDVVTTVNIQHIESLTDVVHQITGVIQHETVPDSFLREAEQVEVIDLTPDALRERLSSGQVYSAERIDAALSNYFRLGNLTALRELALLWLADEVDQALKNYRTEHGIETTWEARERVVVALTGGPEGETLLRRGARIAARSSGGELVAVHVTTQDGLRTANLAALAQQQALVENLGGTYHQIVGSDIPTALVEFARSINATQLVLGASRKGRLESWLTGPGVAASVIRESGDIDVHIAAHAAAAGRFSLPQMQGALSTQRKVAGTVFAVVGTALLSWGLTYLQGPQVITVQVLAYQILVVIAALIGGFFPALLASIGSGLLLDFMFIDPVHRITIADPIHFVVLVMYVINGILVAYVVDRAARHTRRAKRAVAESELIQTVSQSVLRGEDAVSALMDRLKEAFTLDGVRLVEDDQLLTCTEGSENYDGQVVYLPVNSRAHLELIGSDIPSGEQRLLSVIVSQLAVALDHAHLEQTASEIEPIATSDKVRGALLSALGHDLRRPLAAATAAVSGLRAAGPYLSDADKAELIETADESLEALSHLVTDLLDVSRLHSGVLKIATMPIDAADVIVPALEELDVSPDEVDVMLRPTPFVMADTVLLQRAVVNLLANAMRHSPPDQKASISTSEFADTVEIRVVDHGPGVLDERKEFIFQPFHRLGDTDNSTGLGLGLALSKGFVEGMGGTLTPEDTPGGGLTMVISLPAARPHDTDDQEVR